MSKRAVRTLLWLALVGLLAATPAVTAAPQAPAPAPISLAPIDPYILQIIELEGRARFDVVLKLQADLSGAAALATKDAKGRYVYHALTTVAAETQRSLLQTLKTEGAAYRSFWIRNMVRVWGSKDLLLRLAARPDVAEIVYEYPALPDEAAVASAGTGPAAAASRPETVEWNIARVNADDVWAMGITGEGAVVGDLDTGVQWDHPALKLHYRGCKDSGCTTVDHNYNWYDSPDGSPVPYDTGEHGTHTMGTIVGDDGAGNQTGMAPGAQWIACPGIGSEYVGPWECFQFFLAPTKLDGTDPRPELAPDVISNSWSSAGTDYRPGIQALYAAGIFFSKSAGNDGSACGTVTNPGQWPEVTAAAAFNSSDAIAIWSSRGPVTIGHDAFVKPDIAAPGVNVRSSVPTDDYTTMQGTSMACPHVTGAVALLISANPALAGQIDILQKLLKQGAEPKVSDQCSPYVGVPNDVWGWGILDAHASVLAAQAVTIGGIQGTVYDSATSQPVSLATVSCADSGGWTMSAESQGNGIYAKALPSDTYTLTTTAYGYLPQENAGIAVSQDVTTTQDIYLDPAPVWTVSGSVTETGSGDPLAAWVDVYGTPVSAQTDPATGFYTLQVPQGTYWLDVRSPGHARASVRLAVQSDLTHDFQLAPIDNYTVRSSHDTCDPAVYGWIDASAGGTSLCLTDDQAKSVSLGSGKSFTFYGNTYSSIYVSSNGNVLFGSSSSAWSGPIPDPAAPNNGIYAFSTDLNPGGSCSQGTVYYKLVDDHTFVVEWYQVQHYPSGSPETFEVILDLDTGQIVVQYQVVSDPADVVSGVENSTGTEATLYAYGDAGLLAGGTRVVYDPYFGTPPALGPGTISGTVTGQDTLLPIEGASVRAVGSGGALYSAVTLADGTYSMELCADSYTLSASADGYLPSGEVVVELAAAGSVSQDFALSRVYRIFMPLVTYGR